jgi:hypothetical protein
MDLHDETIPSDGDTGHFLRHPQDLVVRRELVPLLTRSPTHPAENASTHATPLRAGAMDFRQHPSRRGNTRVWSDGRVRHINDPEVA